jgi:hypothetical protein
MSPEGVLWKVISSNTGHTGPDTSIQGSSNRALKEWAAIVEAIGRGMQAILLRKYAPARREFFLYPTYEFARSKDYLEKFQPQYREFVKAVVSSKPKKMTDITYYASILCATHREG